MPIEYLLLKDAPVPLINCPKCDAYFEPFLRGQVQKMFPWRFNWRKLRFESIPYCALICWKCKEIIGYEKP